MMHGTTNIKYIFYEGLLCFGCINFNDTADSFLSGETGDLQRFFDGVPKRKFSVLSEKLPLSLHLLASHFPKVLRLDLV